MTEQIGVHSARVLRQADAVRRYLRRVRLATGLFSIALAALGFGLVFPAFSAVDAPWWFRVGWLAAEAVALLAGLIWTAWWVHTTPPLERVAVLAEKRFPHLQDRFVTAVELGLERVRAERPPVAPLLALRVAEQAEAALQELDLREAVDTRAMRRLGGAAAAATVALLASVAVFPSAWAGALRPPRTSSEVQFAPERALAHTRPIMGPSIVGLTLRLEPPAYTQLQPETRSSNLEVISALVGTRVTITASVRGEGVKRTELRLDNGPAGATLGVPFVLTRDTTWQVLVVDQRGRAMQTAQCRLRAVTDRPPSASLTAPGRDVRLAQLKPVRLAYHAQDDWGLTALRLEYRLPGQARWQAMALGNPSARLVTEAWNWDLRPLRLGPGQTLMYRLAATDNDTVSGPKTSRTPTCSITIGQEPMQNAQQGAAAEQAAERETEGLEDLEREVRELGKQLEELAAALDTAELAEPERSRRAAELAEAQRRVAEQADKVSRALSESERQAEREKLAPEAQEKLRELHDLLHRTMNEDLAEALRETRRALQTESNQEFRTALERARTSQQEFAEQLHQAIELLKRARVERNLSRAASAAERLAAEQEQLNRERERLPAEPSPQAHQQSQKQEDLSQREESLEGDLQRLSQEAAEVDKPLGERLGEIARQLRESEASEKLKQAAQMLRGGNPSGAREPQQMALQQLKEAAKDLRDLQGEMTAGASQDAAQAAQELTRDALYLSREQERVLRSAEKIEQFTAQSAARGKAHRERVRRDQEALESSTRELGSRVAELAKRTPLLDLSLARKAEEVAAQMGRAAREAAAGAGPQAVQTQRHAMQGLTELARELIQASEQMRQAASAMAMQGLLQQLQGLAQQQRSLNQQTEQMQGPGQKPQPRGGQGQLADRQQQIREALERLLQKSGHGSQLSDRLGDVPGDMQDVEQQLRENRLSSQTLLRQREILHRMLDAQRSVYQKEQQRRQRVAERPKPFRLPPSPPELTRRQPPPLKPPTASDIERDLPLDFEDVVRQYFRALAELQ